jgi:hypothetical protein
MKSRHFRCGSWGWLVLLGASSRTRNGQQCVTKGTLLLVLRGSHRIRQKRPMGEMKDMPYWWEDHPEERFWCEITDRNDIGADLKCPQRNESGGHYWSYEFINQISPGDVVFHYSTRAKAFVGASVAGAPVEERPIVWAAHGTASRAKRASRELRTRLVASRVSFHSKFGAA